MDILFAFIFTITGCHVVHENKGYPFLQKMYGWMFSLPFQDQRGHDDALKNLSNNISSELPNFNGNQNHENLRHIPLFFSIKVKVLCKSFKMQDVKDPVCINLWVSWYANMYGACMVLL
jgi:hypothetical protein